MRFSYVLEEILPKRRAWRAGLFTSHLAWNQHVSQVLSVGYIVYRALTLVHQKCDAMHFLHKLIAQT